jgi:hypothetical protein
MPKEMPKRWPFHEACHETFHERIGKGNPCLAAQVFLIFPMTTYYYVLASTRFLTEEEPIHEVLKERHRNYQEQEKAVDFWLIDQPAFLNAPELAAAKAKCPQPASAIVSTNPQFITWLKLRLEFVLTGQFEAPSAAIADPLASLAAV